MEYTIFYYLWFLVLITAAIGLCIKYFCYSTKNTTNDEEVNAVNNTDYTQPSNTTLLPHQEQYYSGQNTVPYANQPQWQGAYPNSSQPYAAYYQTTLSQLPMTSSSPPPNPLYNGEASAVAGVPCYYYQAQSPSVPPNSVPANYPTMAGGAVANEGADGNYGHAMYLPRPPNEAIPVLGTQEGDASTTYIAGSGTNGNNINNNNNKPSSTGKPKLEPL